MKDPEKATRPATEEPLADGTTKTWGDSAASSDGTPRPTSNTKSEPRATLTAAWKSIKPTDFLNVHQVPCARIGFLVGIGGGMAVGGLRFIIGAVPHVAANWAVGTGVVISLAQFEYCQWQRRAERAKMKRVVEVYDQKHAEERAKLEKRRLEKIAAAEEEKEANKNKASNYFRFW